MKLSITNLPLLVFWCDIKVEDLTGVSLFRDSVWLSTFKDLGENDPEPVKWDGIEDTTVETQTRFFSSFPKTLKKNLGLTSIYTGSCIWNLVSSWACLLSDWHDFGNKSCKRKLGLTTIA